VFTPRHSAIVTSANPRLVLWFELVEGTVCLNVDGSLLGATSSVGYGGLVWDNNSVFIAGSYGAAVVQSILFAKLMAVLHG
jgi:hypothetical protein